MNREEQLYASALALPTADRAAFLARECADDAALRVRVEALLAANDEADAFFTAAAVNRPVEIPQEKPGDRIGRYKLLQKIGEGGCGVVYMAEQEEPVRRRVALKVVKLGMDTKAVIARFEAERQALALMDHPNIARVLDAGATETGRPYFVMELVRGIPITRYCDEENLPTAQRLQLFVQVCQAIQHAHSKGIIHRDIKPTNILVTMHDDVSVPKVIDFGIAKATQGRLTDRTVFTAFEQFMGTPAYMSPEQAQFNDLDVDARSDIYSLGVLLYELLTGQPPFDPKTLQQQGIDEIRRIIREVEPPRPSAVLSTLGEVDRVAVARRRATAPGQLTTQMSGDLDWIVMRAMEKNRTRRYDSASNFAADIKRHLGNEPVIARPPSVAYRTRKFAARHRFGLVAAATALVALASGLALSRVMERSQGIRALEVGKAPPDTHTLRKLPVGEASSFSSVSPDGRLLVCYPSDSDGIFLCEIATGKKWELIKSTDHVWPWNFEFSPDSRRFVYDLNGKALWIVNVDGSGQRKLREPSAGGGFMPLGWAAGRVIAYAYDAKSTKTAVSIDPETGDLKTLGPLPADQRNPTLSASGRYLALQLGPGNLAVFDLTSQHEEILVPNHVTNVVGWSMGDSELIYRSDRTGGTSWWTISVQDGKAAGEPRLIREYDPEQSAIAHVAQDGRIYFQERNVTSNVCVAAANFETGEIVNEPRLVTEQFPGVQSNPIWSPNGQKLLMAIGTTQRRFATLSLPSGRLDEASVPTALQNQLRQYSWSEDGKTLLVHGGNNWGRFYQIAPGVDDAQLVRTRGLVFHPRLAPGGQSFYFATRKFTSGEADNRSDWRDTIVRRDLQSGAEEVVCDTGDKLNMAYRRGWPFELSPDGKQLALVTTEQGAKEVIVIKIYDLNRKETRELVRFAPREKLTSLRWTPDGARLGYTKELPPKPGVSPQSEIWTTSVAAGAPVKLRISQPGMTDLAIHPDGRQIAFCSQSRTERELWVAQGMLPKPVALHDPARPKLLAQSETVLRPNELVGANNVLHDREKGVTAVLPAGWKVRRAERSSSEDAGNVWPEGVTRLDLDWPGKQKHAVARLYYHTYENPRPATRAECETWLRAFSSRVAASRTAVWPDYKMNPESFTYGTIGRSSALRWEADSTQPDTNEKLREYDTVIRNEKGHAHVFVSARATDIEGLRAAVESFVESVRLP